MALLFDLDGTLVDSVYRQVVAWRTRFIARVSTCPCGRIHRRIGMSGGLFAP
jgi:hypothetical protein